MSKILFVTANNIQSSSLVHALTSLVDILELESDCGAALAKTLDVKFDLVIIDCSNPGACDGSRLCLQYRQQKGTAPVLLLTRSNNLSDKQLALDVGADDQLATPLDVGEFKIKVRMLLKRIFVSAPSILLHHSIAIDSNARTCSVDGRFIRLAPGEFALLEFLMRHPGEVFSPDALLQRVWPSDSEASLFTVRVCISKLRNKLGSGQHAIATVHRYGYKLA